MATVYGLLKEDMNEGISMHLFGRNNTIYDSFAVASSRGCNVLGKDGSIIRIQVAK